MLGQGTIKTLGYPCCRKLGTRHKAQDKVKNKNCNKEVIILHQVFCDHCSTMEGESELSRNKHRITYTYTNYTSYLYLYGKTQVQNLTRRRLESPAEEDAGMTGEIGDGNPLLGYIVQFADAVELYQEKNCNCFRFGSPNHLVKDCPKELGKP